MSRSTLIIATVVVLAASAAIVGWTINTSSQTNKEGANQSTENNVVIKQLKISCPSVKEFCANAQGIIKDQRYVGLGYKLSSGSAIFAAFDGDLTATFSAHPIEANGKTTQQNFKIVYLDNRSINLRAIYLFRGKAKDIKTGKISKGELITVSGKPIKVYDNNSLIFSLIPGYPGSNTPTILNKEDFE